MKFYTEINKFSNKSINLYLWMTKDKSHPFWILLSCFEFWHWENLPVCIFAVKHGVSCVWGNHLSSKAKIIVYSKLKRQDLISIHIHKHLRFVSSKRLKSIVIFVCWIPFQLNCFIHSSFYRTDWSIYGFPLSVLSVSS